VHSPLKSKHSKSPYDASGNDPISKAYTALPLSSLRKEWLLTFILQMQDIEKRAGLGTFGVEARTKARYSRKLRIIRQLGEVY
jgi:hypothetical protein